MSLAGKQDNNLSRPKSIDVGQITGVTITNPGSGYVTVPVLTFAAPPGAGVLATAICTVAGGLITSVTITNPGSGYTTIPVITVGGPGTGAVLTPAKASIVYDAANIIFVDANEAKISDNKARGLSSPGWYNYVTKVNADGTESVKAELLLVMSSNATFAVSGDAVDDTKVEDIELLVITQPTDRTVLTGNNAVFSAVTNPSAGVDYQWQVKIGTAAWTNLVIGAPYTGTTTNSLTVAATTPLNGHKYRLKANTTDLRGAATSVPVKLTVN